MLNKIFQQTIPKPTVEWAIPMPDEPLKQGDIVETTSHLAHDFATIYMIATADCDLANEKHYGRLLALPLLTLSDYFTRFRLPKILSDLRTGKRGLQDLTVNILNELLRLSNHHQLSPEDALDWLNRSGPELICSHLSPTVPRDDEKEFSRFRSRLIATWNVTRLDWNADSIETAKELIRAAKDALGEKLKNGPDGFLEKEVHGLISGNTPKDIFLLSEISPFHDPGYVVTLRFPEQINFSEIALNELGGTGRFRRISRIVYPYSTGVLAQFSGLFTAVGFPDEQKASLVVAGELLIHSWKNGDTTNETV